MKYFISLFVLFIFSCSNSPNRAPSSEAKYADRVAVVFAGAGFQNAMFLGMLEELEKRGIKPDYIVASCGGSIAATIAKAFPTSEERKQFIESEAYYNYVKNVGFHQSGIGKALKTALGANLHNFSISSKIPDFFRNYVLDLPANFSLPGVNVNFDDAGGPKLVVVAGELGYGPNQVGFPSKDYLIQETYFTDPETALQIGAIPSGVELANIKNSYILPKTKIVSNVALSEAVRASIADMFYIAPGQIKYRYYITGGINLYPIELARNLAETVIMPYPGHLDDFIERPVFQWVSGFDNDIRHRFAMRQWATHWVDFSDNDTLNQTYGMNPKPNFLTLSIESKVPPTREEYVTKVRGLWEYGRARMAESLALPTRSQQHIRNR